MASYVKVVD